jgi:hypothetical protein
MIDWSKVFDEAYPEKGATEAIIECLVATVGKPLARSEIAWLMKEQRNPFPRGDPLYASYEPHDVRRWVIPNRPLPNSYLSLLRWSNGGQFRKGRRWFQFFPALDRTNGVRVMMLAYQIPQWMPGAVPFAFNGGGVCYLFDMRRGAIRGEYPILCSHAGNMGLEHDECARVATTFPAACKGKVNVDKLL